MENYRVKRFLARISLATISSSSLEEVAESIAVVESAWKSGFLKWNFFN